MIDRKGKIFYNRRSSKGGIMQSNIYFSFNLKNKSISQNAITTTLLNYISVKIIYRSKTYIYGFSNNEASKIRKMHADSKASYLHFFFN